MAYYLYILSTVLINVGENMFFLNSRQRMGDAGSSERSPSHAASGSTSLLGGLNSKAALSDKSIMFGTPVKLARSRTISVRSADVVVDMLEAVLPERGWAKARRQEAGMDIIIHSLYSNQSSLVLTGPIESQGEAPGASPSSSRIFRPRYVFSHSSWLSF